MGLDNQVPSREQQLVDQDVTTGEWGLAEQITHSERGRFPDDARTLLQRAADERVRQALARGCDREVVADVMDVHPRTTWNKEKRARAYEFPLDAFNRGGRPADDTHSEQPSVTSDTTEGASDEQQRLDAVAEQSAESGEGAGTGEAPESGSDAHAGDEQQAPVAHGESDANREVHARLRRAIDALQAVDNAL